ncbi:hypothetical protein F5884DRAFT_840590 [Xylogone sp. PMI_703]|nr:hypothetical protein F5884DRAFT_840590 [Xylogone sp. PMI_703]
MLLVTWFSNLGEYGTGFYFLQQAAMLAPTCRVLPATTSEVATALNIALENKIPFAVKAGGCGTYAEAANIEGGITIDLSRFKDITISKDRKSVLVGAGCRWQDVYTELDKSGISIVGGRVGFVGVGGLSLGGGISFFSTRKGLACDSIKSYEMVLPNGQIARVTRDSHPDLFWAMRGAGKNFGIVTKFEFDAFDQGNMWAGARQYASQHGDAVLAALDNFNRTSNDEYAEAFTMTMYIQEMGDYLDMAFLSHGKPEEDPPIFDEFKQIPHIASTTSITSLSKVAKAMNDNNPTGLRMKTTSQTIKSDLTTMKAIMKVFKEQIEPHKNIPGFLPILDFQPLTPAMLPKDEIGNTLGISPEDGPLLVVALLWRWNNIEDDEVITKLMANCLKLIEAAATSRGTFHKYMYLNYAAPEQQPFKGYGEKNLTRLLEISKKYDPQAVFSKLRPGYLRSSK